MRMNNSKSIREHNENQNWRNFNTQRHKKPKNRLVFLYAEYHLLFFSSLFVFVSVNNYYHTDVGLIN